MSRQYYSQTEDYLLYQKYFNDVKRYSVMSKQEELKVLDEVKNGNRSAQEKLICANLKFVIKVAFMYRGQGLPISDLISEGNVGLIQAAKRFDPDKKIKFTSYAVWWIRQAIVQALFEKARLVRLSSANELKIRRLKKQKDPISEYSEKTVQNLMLMNQKSVSIHTPLTEKGNITLGDKLSKVELELPETGAIKNSMRQYIWELLDCLTSKEKKVISMFFGLDSGKRLNLTELGELFGLSTKQHRR